MRPRSSDEGSVIPLVLGFFLLALLFVAGAVATSDVFTKQRELQSSCDSAALAAANNAKPELLHTGGAGAGAVPLSEADGYVRSYLARDPHRSAIEASTSISDDGTTVQLSCRATSHVTFGAIIGKSRGVTQTAYASARSPFVQ